jgi:uncharacterized protein (DUF983 family)
MNIFALSDIELMKKSMLCRCPKCNTGALYKGKYSLDLRDICAHCGLDLSKNDSADGPAVLLIFILGTALVPMALLLDAWLSPPLWVHAILWTIITLTLTIGALKPLKSYIIALQYKHRASDWD